MERYIEIIDPSQLVKVGETGNEIRYNCPTCFDVRGKKDNDGKLYFNTEKRKGFCFKCATIFYPETSNELDNTDIQFHKTRETFLHYLKGFDEFERQEPESIYFNFSPLGDDLLSYLKTRNIFLIPLIPLLGLRGWYGKDKGVVTPFFYKEKIVKFQTRFISRKSAPKYYTSEGTKILYSPKHLFGNIGQFKLLEEQTVTLVEGTYDAIACAIMGFPNPLAILGSTLTQYQIFLLKKFSPFKIYCCLDNWKLNVALKSQVLRSLLTVDEAIIHTWGGKDPEEYLRLYIQDQNAKQECAKRVAEWVSGK